MTRRESLIRMAAAGGVGCRALLAGARRPLDGDSLYRDLENYASKGEHRTATAVDARTSEWLGEELHAAGYRTRLMPFQLQQFFLHKAELTVAGEVVKSFPMWWPQPTGSTPVRGGLTMAAPNSPGPLAGKIALVKLGEVKGAQIVPGDSVHQAIEPVIRAGAAAIVAIASSPTGEIMPLNAMSGTARWSIPIVLAGQADEAALEQWAAKGAPASLLIEGVYQQNAEAHDVIGRLERGRRMLMVTTPSSGWFHCAGERGPGIALWLGLARWAARRKSRFTYQFVASPAHELDGLGLREFIRREPPRFEDLVCWLHLGAGIATYDYKKTGDGLERLGGASPLRKLYSVARFLPALKDAFADLPDLIPTVTDKPAGEMILLAEKGYPYFGFAGGSVFHHAPGDLPETTTGPELLEPVGTALLKALTTIENSIGG